MQPQSHGSDHYVPIGFIVHITSRRAALHRLDYRRLHHRWKDIHAWTFMIEITCVVLRRKVGRKTQYVSRLGMPL